jgi:predicted  nucleic acid-binding Zn-ribbon protein
MNAYEFKKLQVEYKRVNAAREEQELQILGLEDQIKRIQISIDISIEKEKEIEEKIKSAKVE